jgi:hypothetical protein
MTATDRLTGIVLLATLVAAAGTLFGALAVPEEHAHGDAAKHHEAEALRVGLAGVGEEVRGGRLALLTISPTSR